MARADCCLQILEVAQHCDIAIINAKRMTLVLFSLLCIVILTACETVSPEETEQTRSICSNIPIPASFVKISDRNIQKANAVTFTTEYASDASVEAIAAHFDKYFDSPEWKASPWQRPGTTYLEFRQGRFTVAIEMDRFTTGSNRHFGVSCSCGL
jgi:hypothetical protein